MRRNPIAALLLLASVLSCSKPKTAPASGDAHHARLIAVEGDVRVKRAAANDYEAAAKGAVLDIADIVSTGVSGHATISFDDGSTAMVTPHSLVSIEPPAASAANGISVQSGRWTSKWRPDDRIPARTSRSAATCTSSSRARERSTR